MIIGITGGIGTGKSTVADYLAEKGYTVISADKVAREIVEPGSPVLSELALEFGSEIINKDGTLNRKLLATLAFSNAEKKVKLDELTHKRIIEIMMERGRAGEGKGALVFMDVPLLFESGMDKLMDKIWVVDAPHDLRVARIQARDGLSLKEIQNRLRFQLDSSKRREMADLVLDNALDKRSLYMAVNRALNELEREMKA